MKNSELEITISIVDKTKAKYLYLKKEDELNYKQDELEE